MKELETDRLKLRKIKIEDAKAMFDVYTQDERVTKYTRWNPHKNLNDTIKFVEYCISDSKPRWMITLKENNAVIGMIDVVRIDNIENSCEIGYVIGYDYWNKGYVTEAFKTIIENLFKSGYDKINACHHFENVGSGKVMLKCGMKYINTEKGIAKYGTDELVDVLNYEILKKI